jgi:ADP-ribosylation factor related protein 1
MLIAGCNIVFWDLGGQSGMRSIWTQYYEEAHGIVFVLDATNKERFEEAKAALGTSASIL